MKTNESKTERIFRVLAGVILLVLSLIGIISGGVGTAASIIGVVLILTGLIGFCPLYSLLKINTKKS